MVTKEEATEFSINFLEFGIIKPIRYYICSYVD